MGRPLRVEYARAVKEMGSNLNNTLYIKSKKNCLTIISTWRGMNAGGFWHRWLPAQGMQIVQ